MEGLLRLRLSVAIEKAIVFAETQEAVATVDGMEEWLVAAILAVDAMVGWIAEAIPAVHGMAEWVAEAIPVFGAVAKVMAVEHEVEMVEAEVESDREVTPETHHQSAARDPSPLYPSPALLVWRRSWTLWWWSAFRASLDRSCATLRRPSVRPTVSPDRPPDRTG
jgi:hypothetical protein